MIVTRASMAPGSPFFSQFCSRRVRTALVAYEPLGQWRKNHQNAVATAARHQRVEGTAFDIRSAQ